jgi:acetylornithine deacetylase
MNSLGVDVELTDLAAQARNATERRRDWIVDHLRDAVRIPSETGAEGPAATFYAAALGELGLEVRLETVDPERVGDAYPFWDQERDLDRRPNVLGRWASDPSRPFLVLNGHVDVVPPGDLTAWRGEPYSGDVRDGRIVGRGAADMKGGLAAAIGAVAVLRDLGITPPVNLELQCVIGEEWGGLGTIAAICQGSRPDAVIVLEPTELALARAQAGILKFTLEVSGRAAHTSAPWLGVSAFDKLVFLYERLGALAAVRHGQVTHPLFSGWQHRAPFAVGLVQAGHHGWTLPDRATAAGRFGVLPGEDLDEARRQFEAVLAAASDEDAWLQKHRPIVRWAHGAFRGWETSAETAVVWNLRCALDAVRGEAIEEGVLYGSDASHFVELASVPSVVFGPGSIAQAHIPDEWIAVDDVLTATTVLAVAIAAWKEAEHG